MPTVRHHLKRCTTWLQTNRVYTVGVLAVVFAFAAAFPAHASGFEETLASGVATIFHILTFFLAFIINAIGYAVGKLLVLVLGMVIIPILGYNGFADSSLIDIGWPLVRDVVNMFVIVILLVVAIRTILGIGDKGWEQQLPRLFIAIVLVNFSRTVTLLIVDVGQVVMFTFVNALRDIAAGNFVNMFSLTDFFTLNSDNIEASNSFEAGASALNDLGYLATSYATLIFLIAVFAVMVLLAIVFIYRIVIIWVLTIMSPAAFFLSGIKSIVPKAGGPAEQWWTKLIGAVALGPILTFFLWLALASAAEGSIASSEGFPTEGTEDVPTLLSEALGIEQLLSLFLAMVLIMAGFQAASASASGLGGFAGKMINEGTGERLVKNAAKAPASFAARGAKLGYRGAKAGGRLALRAGKMAAIEGARQLQARGGYIGNIGSEIMRAGGDLEARGGFAGRTAGKLVRRLGGYVKGQAEGMDDAAREASKERLDSMTRDERVANLMALTDRFEDDGSMKEGAFMRASDRHDVEEGMLRLLTDEKERKKLANVAEDRAAREAQGRDFDSDDERDTWIQQRKEQIHDEQMKRAFKWAESDNGKAMLDDKKADLNKAKAGNLRAMGNAKDIGDFLGEMGDDFKLSMLSEEDMKNDEVLKALAAKEMKSYQDRNGNWIVESALDQAAAGKGGTSAKVKRAARGEGVKFDDLVKYAGQDEDGNPIRVEGGTAVGQALKNNQLQLKDLKVEHLSTPDAAGNMELDPNKIAMIAQAIADSKSDAGDLSNLPPDVYQRVLGQMRGNIQAAFNAGDMDEVKKYRKALLSASDRTEAQFTGIGNDGALPTTEVRQVVNEFVIEQPSQIGSLQTIVDGNAGPTDVTDTIVRNVNATTLKNMQNLLNQAINEGNTALETRIRESAKTIAMAHEKEMGRDGANRKQLQQEARKYGQIGRYGGQGNP